MTVALRRPMTVAEFLAWEDDQEERWGALITDPAADLDMPEIGVSLPLIDAYEGVFEG